MARELMRVVDSLDKAAGISQGIGALGDLLSSAREGDVPSGKAISEILGVLQRSLDEAIDSARAGLKQ